VAGGATPGSEEGEFGATLLVGRGRRLLDPDAGPHLNAANAKAIQIRVWTIENGALEMTKLVYPNGRVEEFLVAVDLLKSNGVVELYDLMRRNW